MFYKQLKLEYLIESMREMGEILIPFNYPLVPLSKEGDCLSMFKEKEIIVDGYSVIIHYQKSDYGNHYLETLQISGKSTPFLPFILICKLAKRFLGSHHLSLVEIFKNNRKFYVWTLFVNNEGEPIASPLNTKTEECEFEGFNYLYMDPTQVNFY